MKTHWEKIADLDFYTEGPGLDAFGNLFCTTLTGGAILKISPSGEMSEWSRLRCPNGQRILDNGDHLICDTGTRAVVKLGPNGAVMEYLAQGTCAGVPFKAPNDLVTDGEGGFYFTDSVRHRGQVFYTDGKGCEKRVTGGLDYPNGIALSKDGKFLFVAESYANRILYVELSEPGLGKSGFQVFADLPSNSVPEDPAKMPYTANLPDGIALDRDDRLWVAHYGMGVVQVLDPDGTLLASIPTGIPATSNLTFSRDYKSIYVTGGSGEPGPGMIHKINLENLVLK